MFALGRIRHIDALRVASVSVLHVFGEPDAEEKMPGASTVEIHQMPADTWEQEGLFVRFRLDIATRDGASGPLTAEMIDLAVYGHAIVPCEESQWYRDGEFSFHPAIPLPHAQTVVLRTNYQDWKGFFGPWKHNGVAWKPKLPGKLLFWELAPQRQWEHCRLALPTEKDVVEVWLDEPSVAESATAFDAADNRELGLWFADQMHAALSASVLESLDKLHPEWRQHMETSFEKMEADGYLALRRWQRVMRALSTAGGRRDELLASLDIPATVIAGVSTPTRDSDFAAAGARETGPPDSPLPEAEGEDEWSFVHTALAPGIAAWDSGDDVEQAALLFHCALLVCPAVRVPHPGWSRAFVDCFTDKPELVVRNANPRWTEFDEFWNTCLSELWRQSHANRTTVHLLHINNMDLGLPELWFEPIFNFLSGYTESLPEVMEECREWPKNLRILWSADEDASGRFPLSNEFKGIFPFIRVRKPAPNAHAGDRALAPKTTCAEWLRWLGRITDAPLVGPIPPLPARMLNTPAGMMTVQRIAAGVARLRGAGFHEFGLEMATQTLEGDKTENT